VLSLQRLGPKTGPKGSDRQGIDYFQTNRSTDALCRFPQTRNYFVGSGVIEAGCKTIIGQRLKRSGMHWTVRGANPIIALRCLPDEWPLGGILGGSLGQTS